MPETKHSMELKTVTNKLVDLRLFRTDSIKNDILSGVTVALALVPEAIAFAFVAGVNPRVGLYAALGLGLDRAGGFVVPGNRGGYSRHRG